MTYDPYDVAAGARLREAREAAGLSREEVGQRVGLSVSGVQLHENGRNGMKAHQVSAYCRVLGISVGWLLEGTGMMRHEPSEVIDVFRQMPTDADRETWIALGKRLAGISSKK